MMAVPQIRVIDPGPTRDDHLLRPVITYEPGWSRSLYPAEQVRCTEAVDQIRTLAVQSGNLPIRALHVKVSEIGITMRTTMSVLDRDSGQEVLLQISTTLSHLGASLVPHTPMLELVREALRAAILHELDECLLVDGKRKWDPHKEGPHSY